MELNNNEDTRIPYMNKTTEFGDLIRKTTIKRKIREKQGHKAEG